MQSLADWLKDLEHTACEVYKKAALYFRDNEQLHQFFRYLSNDEAWHYHLMGSASDYYSRNSVPADIALDDETKRLIMGFFDEIGRQIEAGTLTEEKAMSLVARAEFSEWNDIFLYVVQDLTNRNYEFSFGTSKIQHHMKFIEEHLSSYMHYPDLLEEFGTISPVWKKRILIIEDKKILVTLLASVLRKEGLVEVAWNGEEALQMIRHHSFDLVMSDIRMPVMDGLELFRLVESDYPELIGRYIFHTSESSAEINELAEEHGIPVVTKPSSLSMIRQVVHDVLGRASLVE